MSSSPRRVRLERVRHAARDVLDPARRSRPAARVPSLRSSASAVLAARGHPERAAHHLRSGVGPAGAVALDRVAGLRPAVRPVHHAHEVRRRRRQPELHGPVVQRPNADARRRRRCARGSSPARSPARSRSRRTNPGEAGSSTRLMPNSTSCAVSGSPSDQRSPSRRWNTYRSPSSARSPTVRRATGTIVRSGHASTSRSNSCMQSWMFGHAIADFGSASFGRKLVATRSVAVGAVGGRGRRPQVERPLVGGVRLGEPQRDVQGERELEQHERDLVAFAPALHEREQLAVLRDGLVERVLLPRPVGGPRQVLDGLVLVRGGQPVVRQDAGRPSSRPRRPAARATPPPAGAGGRRSARRASGTPPPGSARA